MLTVGQKIEPEAGGKAENVSVVTLLLKPEDAQKLVLASTQGSIHFVLRNGADRGRVAPVPVRVSQISSELRSPESAPAVRAHVAAKHSYEVETIMGDKHVTEPVRVTACVQWESVISPCKELYRWPFC